MTTATIEIRYSTGEVVKVEFEEVQTIGVKNEMIDYESPEYFGLIDVRQSGVQTVSITGRRMAAK